MLLVAITSIVGNLLWIFIYLIYNFDEFYFIILLAQLNYSIQIHELKMIKYIDKVETRDEEKRKQKNMKKKKINVLQAFNQTLKN